MPTIAALLSSVLVLFTASALSAQQVPNSPAADGDGWVELFNGRDLTGWHIACKLADKDKTFWTVVDGCIVLDSTGSKKHDYVWLMSDGEYSDFELEVKFQAYRNTTGNSGVQVRSRYDHDAGWLSGPQVDIHPPGPWRTGFIYDETRGVNAWLWPDVGAPRNARPEHAPKDSKFFYSDEGDGWNTLRIVCNGTRIATYLNGTPIADVDARGRLDDERHRALNVGMHGHIALQLHSRDEIKLRFRQVRIREMK